MSFHRVNPSSVTLSPFRQLGAIRWASVKMGRRDLEILSPEMQAVYDGCNYGALVVTPLPGNTFLEWMNRLCARVSGLLGKELASSPLKEGGRLKLKLKPSATIIGLESVDQIRSGDVVECRVRFGVYQRGDEYGVIANVKSVSMVGQELIQEGVDSGAIDISQDVGNGAVDIDVGKA